MSEAVGVVWDNALTDYDFGHGHPLAPVRVELTLALARALGVLDRRNVEMLPVTAADDALLRTVHDADYIEAVKRAAPDGQFGLGSSDNPVFAGMHDASRLVAGASVSAARAVWEGGHDHAVNVAGGLHHAMPGVASGFCVYNDPAIAIRWLLHHGAQRVAYVDVDVHHGDGVQAIFYDDPRVLTISLHESGRYLFPGTGFAEEIGAPGAEGTAVNVALPPGTDDAAWLRAFHAVVPPLVTAFAPDVLVSQHGCDSHALDPLAHLMLSVDGQRASYLALHDLAHTAAGGRWLATGGGGYELVQVVPRAWTHLLAAVTGSPLAPDTVVPDDWRELARARVGESAPSRLTDGREASYRPWTAAGADVLDRVDRAVLDVRAAVFARHDIDPAVTA